MPQKDQGQARQTVRRRHVFFVPGFDPNAPRRYRELYRREAASQSEICGYKIDVARIAQAENFSWSIKGEFDDKCIDTTFELLTWEDIVRSSMARSVPASYWVMICTIWIYARSGAFARLWRLRWTPMLVAIYPVVALIIQAILALVAARIVMWAVSYTMLPPAAVWAFGIGGFFAVLELFRRSDRRHYAYYLIHDYGFNASERGRTPAPLRERLGAFADRICQVAGSGVDEVLVIGHSTGAQLAVSAMHLALQKESCGQARLGLLTLGQVIPMQSFLPKADDLRTSLAALSQSEAITWVDVSAPGDGACFALTDPVAVSGVGQPHAKGPLVISAAYSQSLSKERQAAFRRKYFRQHIQYLCAFDNPQGYDFFAITAGPQSLGERFEGRASSPSRIDKVLSRYTSVE